MISTLGFINPHNKVNTTLLKSSWFMPGSIASSEHAHPNTRGKAKANFRYDSLSGNKPEMIPHFKIQPEDINSKFGISNGALIRPTGVPIAPLLRQLYRFGPISEHRPNLF